ncbi:MAG: hypothetical protein EAZ09_11680, partial [Oscillatoriales cyanobacterium]
LPRGLFFALLLFCPFLSFLFTLLRALARFKIFFENGGDIKFGGRRGGFYQPSMRETNNIINPPWPERKSS